MKKFTKGCLMTALVLFLVGMILCVVCGLLGGFRQLNEMDGIRGLPFWYGRNAINGVERGLLGHEVDTLGALDDIDDIDNNDISGGKDVLEKTLKELEGKKEQLPLTAGTLGSIEIDVEACSVVILRSEDEHVWFFAESESHDYEPHYTIENNGKGSALCIENEVKHPIDHWRNGPNNTMLYLWLPEGCALEECGIDIGAGLVRSIFIKAEQVNVSVGAGALDADGFEGDEVRLTVGAGEILAERVTAGKADIEIGAGHLSIEELLVSREADVNVNAGNCEITGTIAGDLDLECDMGETVLRLTGSEDDHSYDVECGMGEVTVGGFSHSGFAVEKSWNAGKDSQFDIDCSMGVVTLTFDK